MHHFVKSKKILRILRISEKYKQRPSEVIGIDNSHLAFCFDEACDYILSMRTTKEINENGKTFLKESWIKEPAWIDEDDRKEEKPKVNNNELINEMKKNLQNFK